MTMTIGGRIFWAVTGEADPSLKANRYDRYSILADIYCGLVAVVVAIGRDRQHCVVLFR